MRGLSEIEKSNIGLVAAPTRPLAGPFPNLRVRELVKRIVSEIVETCAHGRFTDGEKSALALGMIRGARLTAEEVGDDTAAPFLADLLDTFNNQGLDGVHLLVESVTGREDTLN